MANRSSKQIVTEKYPDAKPSYVWTTPLRGPKIKTYIIQNDLLVTLGRGESVHKAWQDASKNLQAGNV